MITLKTLEPFTINRGRAVLLSEETPDSLSITGTDVEGLPDGYILAEGSVLITADAKYIAFEDGVFTEVDNTEEAIAALQDAVASIESNVSDLQDSLETKAEIDGYYDELTSGNAEQLIATVGVTESVPYNFRTAGGSADIGNRETDTIVGGTIVWNQLRVDSIESGTVNGITLDYSDGIFSVSGTSTSTYRSIFSRGALTLNHKYLIDFKILTNPNDIQFRITGLNSTIGYIDALLNSSLIVYCKKEVDPTLIAFSGYTSGTVFDDVTFKFNIFDLTQMFGTTIADYLYSLETATAGVGVAWFKKLFPKDYYSYNAGELMSVNVSAHEMVGFNQWDEEWLNGYYQNGTGNFINHASYICSKNKIRVIPGATYNFKSSVNLTCYGFDADGNWLALLFNGRMNIQYTMPDNVQYIVFNTSSSGTTTYDGDICINLSWTGYRNGEYEEYEKHTYALDSTLTLRGIPKLDSSNNLYYDGDTYESDGTVTRKYGVRAYASGDESDTTVITDGTNTVYELASTTTETADPYTNPQIVDDYGTESYTDYAYANGDRDVAIPVGHETFYMANLRDKLQHLPDLADSDGRYCIQQTDNQMSLVADTSPARLDTLETKVPDPPTSDGTYTLQVTVSDGTPTYAWV